MRITSLVESSGHGLTGTNREDGTHRNKYIQRWANCSNVHIPARKIATLQLPTCEGTAAAPAARDHILKSLCSDACLEGAKLLLFDTADTFSSVLDWMH